MFPPSPAKVVFVTAFNRPYVSILAYKKGTAVHMKGGDLDGKEKTYKRNIQIITHRQILASTKSQKSSQQNQTHTHANPTLSITSQPHNRINKAQIIATNPQTP